MRWAPDSRALHRKNGTGPSAIAPRFATTDDAILQEINPLSFERQKIKVVNVSEHRIGILTPDRIFPGTLVQIRIGDAVELGEVRHCLELGHGYRVGVRLHLPS